jgi:hypothetical protein
MKTDQTMKTFIQKYGIMATLGVAVMLLMFTSCSKDEPAPTEAGVLRAQQGTVIKDKATQDRIKELKGQLPTVLVYNHTMDKYISLDLNNPKSFTFTNPSGGLSFSSPQGSVQFVAAPGGTLQIITTPAGSGGGGGGGIVTAGDISLDINYVLCFASGDPDAEFNIFDIGPDGEGISGAIGIAGNFEALMSGDFDEDDLDPFDFFQGFVGYLVFDGTASGTYPVIDFFEAEEDESSFDNKGIAYLWSFQQNQMGIFFSKSGNLTFGGSSVEFNGTYFGMTGLFDFFEMDEDDFNFVEVEGSGVLECN